MSKIITETTSADEAGNHNPLATFDLKKTLAGIKAQDAWRKGDRSARTLIKDHRQRITLVALRGGTTVAPHQANGSISVQMLEGSMKFMTPLRTAVLAKGQILTLQAKIQHSMEALGDCAFLLTLSVEPDEVQHPALAGPGLTPKPVDEIGTRSKTGPAPVSSGRGKKTVTEQHVTREFRRLLPADGKPVLSLGEYEATGGLAGLRRALTMSADRIIDELKTSGLRGRGGAGFPTGVKWASVTGSGRGKRYACCNGAEGEPGTFKDRYLLRMNPYLTLEGLAIAAHAVGAHRVFFCIKRSFRKAADRLRQAIEEFHAAKLFPPGRELKIELVLGPEEYLFGEEKALLEVVEGNLPLPRWLPPYMEGLFCGPLQDNPTLVNNAETLANVALILRSGPEWYRGTGTAESPGTMIFTLCGDVSRPGCYELPLGTTMRDLLENFGGGVIGGRRLKAILPGVSNGVLTPGYLDVPLDFDSMRAVGSGLGSGGYIVYDDSVCIVRAAALVSRFLYVESCGQCPPCKFSSGEITRRLDRLAGGTGDQDDIDAISTLCATADQGNRCALPTGEHLMIESFLNRFSDEFHAHIHSACKLERKLILPKLVDYDEQTRIFTSDEHQPLKQPDWSYAASA